MRRALVPSLVLVLAAPQLSRAAEPVRVTNFPDVQRVQVEAFPRVQDVKVSEHLPVTKLVAWKNERVPPALPSTGPNDLERYHELGRLDATGYRSLGISVAGRFTGTTDAETSLELVLLPDQPVVRDAWKRDGILLLEQRLRIDLEERGKGLFQAQLAPIDLRFDRYLAFLRNDAQVGMEVSVFVLKTE